MNKIALGSAQFGMNYGIKNSSKVPTNEEIKKILDLSKLKKIDLIDTAMEYGSSEKKIGNNDNYNFKVITKLPSLDEKTKNLDKWIKEKVDLSLKNLKRSTLYGLLFHDPNMLLGSEGNQIYETVNDLKKDGIIEKIGLSIYSPSSLDFLVPKYKIDIVQAPFNLIDRRLLHSGWLKKLDNLGIEVHARSIFLQGLLLTPCKEIPKKFEKWTYLFKKLEEWANQNKIELLEACVLYVSSFKMFKKIIIGIDNIAQLDEILNISSKSSLSKYPNLSCNDEALIDPSKWER